MCMKRLLFIILTMLLVTGCRRVDNVLFKQEFEKENYNNIQVSIPSDNPFVYITDSELVKKIENKENIIVLCGYAKSKETRLVIENLMNVSKKLNIKTIYYLDIIEIRDEKKYENNEVKTIKQGTDEYNKLLELLKDNLKDYKINNQIVGKRIYAPTILKIDNNISITNGLCDNYDINNYTNDMKQQSYDIIYNFLKTNNICNPNEGC